MKRLDAREARILQNLHGLELASFRRRGAALGIDVAFAAMLFSAILSPFKPLLIRSGWIADENAILFTFFSNWYSAAWLVLYFGLATRICRGRTPGKRLVGIRTIALFKPELSLWQSVERALGYGVSVLECGFGFIQYFFHANGQTVHDRLAETVVIRDPAAGRKRSRGKIQA